MKEKETLDYAIKFSLNGELMKEIENFTDGMSKELGRKVSMSQVMRWITESYFGISSIYMIPTAESALIGPEKALAESLDERDNLSTQLREVQEDVNALKKTGSDLEEHITNIIGRLLRVCGQNGMTSLENSSNIVIEELKKTREVAKNLKEKWDEQANFTANIISIFGVSYDPDNNEDVLQRCKNRNKEAHQTLEIYIDMAERNLGVLKEVADELDMPYKSIDSKEKFEQFKSSLLAAATLKMRAILTAEKQVIQLIDATGINSEYSEGFQKGISPSKIQFAAESILSDKNEIELLEIQKGELTQQRDEFENLFHEETSISNRLLERVKLYRDVLRDWLSVVAANRRSRGFFRKLFGIDIRINNQDRAWANKETEDIQKGIEEALKPPKE